MNSSSDDDAARRLSARINASIERRMRDAFYGASTIASNQAENQPPLTLETLRLLRLRMPKPTQWLCTRLFPGREALKVEGSRTNFVVAGPDFWNRLQYEIQRDASPSRNPLTSGGFLPYGGFQVIEIDGDPQDPPHRQAYLRELWDELIDAIKVACVELPEWLRSAPRYGSHG